MIKRKNELALPSLRELKVHFDDREPTDRNLNGHLLAAVDGSNESGACADDLC